VIGWGRVVMVIVRLSVVMVVVAAHAWVPVVALYNMLRW
jgi:hypothetical protein